MNSRIGSIRWRRALKRAIRLTAWRIVQVCVYPKGSRKAAYVCMAVPGGNYLCGLCGHKEVRAKMRDKCPECGATVCRIVKAYCPEIAKEIQVQMRREEAPHV